MASKFEFKLHLCDLSQYPLTDSQAIHYRLIYWEDWGLIHRIGPIFGADKKAITYQLGYLAIQQLC